MDRTLVRFEKETLAYKSFMKVAKRIARTQYGKWTITPDMTDPLRKFTLNKDIGWATIRLGVCMEEFYHRGNYSESRYDYRPKLSIAGLLVARDVWSNIKITPRMAKKTIKYIEDVVVPKWYDEIDKQNQEHSTTVVERAKFNANIASVPGLMLVPKTESWGQQKGTLKNCPFDLSINADSVELNNTVSYAELAVMAKKNGWGI